MSQNKGSATPLALLAILLHKHARLAERNTKRFPGVPSFQSSTSFEKRLNKPPLGAHLLVDPPEPLLLAPTDDEAARREEQRDLDGCKAIDLHEGSVSINPGKKARTNRRKDVVEEVAAKRVSVDPASVREDLLGEIGDGSHATSNNSDVGDGPRAEASRLGEQAVRGRVEVPAALELFRWRAQRKDLERRKWTDGILQECHRLDVLGEPDLPVVLTLGETEEPDDAATRLSAPASPPLLHSPYSLLAFRCLSLPELRKDLNQSPLVAHPQQMTHL